MAGKQLKLFEGRQLAYVSGVDIDGNVGLSPGYHPDITRLTAETTEFPAVLMQFRTSGYHEANGTGASWYRRVTALGSGKIGFADFLGNGFWELWEDKINVYMAGAKGDGINDDYAAAAAAYAHSPYVEWPVPVYWFVLSATIALPPGAHVVGRGGGSGGQTDQAPSFIYCTHGGYAFTMDAPVGRFWEGPQFSNVLVYCSNGLRLGDADLGFNQGFISETILSRTTFNNNGTLHTGTGVQVNIAFHFLMHENCEVLGFAKLVDIYRSDFVTIKYSRLWQFGEFCIRATADSTFGSHLVVERNDLLAGATGATAYIIVDAYGGVIEHNYIEQTVAQGIIGCGIKLGVACLGIHVLHNSVNLQTGSADWWLDCDASDLHIGRFIGNFNSGQQDARFNGGLGANAHYSGGNGTITLEHYGNTHERGFPFNTIDQTNAETTTPDIASLYTPAVRGVLRVAFSPPEYANGWYIKDNALTQPPLATGSFVEYADPKYTTGVLDVWVCLYADAEPQSARIFCSDGYFTDGGPFVADVTFAATTKPTWYLVASSVTFSTRAIPAVYNIDSQGPNDIHVVAVALKKPTNLKTAQQFVSELPTAVNGQVAYVTDGAPALAPGATITGGGTTHYFVGAKNGTWVVLV